MAISSIRESTFLRAIRVPDDIGAVTTIARNDEVDAREVGMTSNGVKEIWQGVENYYRTGVHPAISVCIRRRGKIVLKRALGHLRGNGPDDGPNSPKTLATPDTPFCQFSASKAVTAMLIHHLDQSGKVHLMDPVCRYIPEFAQHGKEGVTLLHVLAHQSGFPRAPSSVDRDLVFDFDGMVQMLCSMKPAHRPGHEMAYHAITGGYILGEVVRRVTGKSVSEYLQDTLRGPMGWKYFTYGADDAVVPEIAENENTGYPLVFPFTTLTARALGCAWSDVLRFTRDPRFYRTVIPAANLVATADEMSEFFQLLLNGGVLHDTRVFQPETVRRATLEAGKMRIDGSMVLMPMRYSAGMMLGADPFGLYGPRSGHAFGHWGFINSFSWADPSRDIAVSILNSGKPFLGPHVLRHFALFGLIDRHCPQDATVS